MSITREELITKLDLPLTQMVSEASGVHRRSARVSACTIMNAKSGRCGEDCRFCAQSGRHRTSSPVYPLRDDEEIFAAALRARDVGSSHFSIVTSGNSLTSAEVERLVYVVKRIREEVGIEVCGSLGAMDGQSLGSLYAAGMRRYHHNIETSRRFYSQIVTTHTFDDRLKTIAAAREVGFEICSGGIIGLGENWDDRVDMALTLRELDVDAVPLNILIPIPGTAIYGVPAVSAVDVVRTVALFRLALPDKTIILAAGRESVLRDFQALAFMAGADGMLIGGYLTVAGRAVEDDQRLMKEIEMLWM
jgi:biotin synthase